MQEEVTDDTATIVEPKKEIVECDHDYETTHLSSKEVENTSELVIIDTAMYDPEFPTPEDDNIIPILEDVEKNINETATNNTTNTPFSSKHLDEKQRKLLENLESRIIKDNLNVSKLPPDICKTLKEFHWRQRAEFKKQIRKKLEKRNKQNILPSSFSQWLSEQWSAMEGNIESEEYLKINSNTLQLFTKAEKLQFFSIIEKMFDCDMININKIPVEVWDCLKQLPERKQFIQAMKEKQAARRSSGGPASSFIPLSNSPSKTDFRETNQASHSQSKCNEKPNSSNKLYSFDMDFNNQKLGKSSIATTSTLSQHNSNNQATSMNRNPAYSSVSSYPSFNANFQSPNSAAFNSYDRDGASQPSCSNATSLYSGGICRSENGSKMQAIPNQSLYNNPSKRKLPAFSSYNQPQQKRSNTIFDKPHIEPKDKSILAAIHDVNDQKGKMNGAGATLLSNMLIRRLGEPATGFIPRFNNSGLNSDGVFTINCADQKSFDWLTAMVSGTKFYVTKYVKYSEHVQVALFIANGGVVETSATIIPRIKIQNPGLTTESWKVLKQTITPAGQVFLLSIDLSSEQLLKTMNYNVFLGLSSVKYEGSFKGDLSTIDAGGPSGETSNAPPPSSPQTPDAFEKRLLEKVDGFSLDGRPKKRPICGAEKKRRRKARAAASAPDNRQEALTSGGSKRRLPPGETPPESRQPEKKPKVPSPKPSSYDQAVESTLRVAIVSDGYPKTKISEAQFIALDTAIWKALVGLPHGGATPTFHDSCLVQGAYMVSCDNEASREWLKEAVKSLKPWEDAKLQLVEQSVLPKLKRMMVWIPGVTRDITEIFTLLERQNPGLRTGKWRLYRKEPSEKGLRLIVGVDDSSEAFLKAKDYNPFLGMKRVTFRFLEKTPGQGKEPAKATTDKEAQN